MREVINDKTSANFDSKLVYANVSSMIQSIVFANVVVVFWLQHNVTEVNCVLHAIIAEPTTAVRISN